MKFARLRQPALSALAVLLISGAGIAFAGNRGASAPASGQVMPPAVEHTTATTESTIEAVEPAGADTDTLQEGDQTTPDTSAEQAAEAAGSEKAGVEEPGDANLPGGGHADNPNDPNADHQAEGVE